MAGQPTPPVITEPFAKNAAAPYIQNPIPLTTGDPARASYDLGFPPQTMTEIFAGGTPPFGQDVNGILFAVTSHIAALQAGQPYLFSSLVAAAISGYALGTVLGMSDGSGLWVNQTNGNSNDPDAGGAGWLPLYSSGYASAPTTGGTLTLTSAQYKKGVIVLSGALVGNLQVVLPTSLRSWLIVNTTSGAFSTTVKTSGGFGVTVPQGGFAAPKEVYGDGTNIYPTVAPITIPTDVNPTANTIPLRSNSGYIFATYFNSTNGLESFSASGVYASAGDGFHRLLSLANLAAQISLSQFAGTVANAQVPQSAVTQHTAAVLASAALTGTPTAPTPPAGNNSTRVATTAFVQGSLTPGSGLVNTQGSFTLPGGAIVKMGYAQGAAGIGDIAVAFTAAFPNACWGVVCCTANRNGAGSAGAGYSRAWSAAGFTGFFDQQQTNTNGGTIGNRGGVWIAVGN